MNYSERFSEVSRAMGSSMIRELVASTKNIPDLISFAGGFPSPRTFPKDILSEIYSEVVKTNMARVRVTACLKLSWLSGMATRNLASINP